jgi:formamidopyrimidine-DNA glycosylase
VVAASSPHKFAFYCEDPTRYPELLAEGCIKSASGHGMFVDIFLDNETRFTISDGTNLRYYQSGEKLPAKHQLLIAFEEGDTLVCTIAMYGGIWVYKEDLDNSYHQGSLQSISPLNDAFNEQHFESVFNSVSKDISVKALLATEQRIPGLGNGVLQDILFNAGIHPRCKKNSLSDLKKGDLFHSLKVTLQKMTEESGRDTEKDLFGNPGKYKTLLSKNTYKNPCPNCGNSIVKEAYMGGSVYFCPVCQAL